MNIVAIRDKKQQEDTPWNIIEIATREAFKLVGKRDGAFAFLSYERLVNMRNNSTTSNRGLDQGVKLFVPTDSKLKDKKKLLDFQRPDSFIIKKN